MRQTIEALRRALGDVGVLTGDDVRGRDTGWGRQEPCLAAAVARPRTTEEVAETLRICHAADQPVVVQGGMTGLVEGAVPGEQEIALSLERMTNIEELDAIGRTMTVQAGVTLQTIHERAEAEDLMFPVDLGARGSCHIGGNVATNAGGSRVIRYGMTRESILGLEAVLADGTVVTSLNRMLKNNAAYDLKHLFIGSEGTLGVVTRLVLRLRPRARSRQTAMIAVQEFGKVTSLLAAADRGLGGGLAAFEVMWTEFYDLVTRPPAHGKPVLPQGSPYYVLMESLGGEPEADGARFQQVLEGCAEAGFITDAAIATSATERETFWALRDDVEQLFQLRPVFVFDISLPLRTMESYVEEIRRDLRAAWDEPACVIFGHLGDGNLHIAVGVGAGDAETRRRVEETIYGPLRAREGSVSAEHGIGIEKRPYLSWCRSEAELALMRTLKDTLDPKGILNRGRVLTPA